MWNQAPREGLQLHWDGNNDSVDERNLSAGLGAGITPVTVDHAGLARVRQWTWTLKPPAYPYPVDRTLAARGAAVYGQSCASCHGDHRFRDGQRSGDRLGQVEDIDRIGTDRHRLDSYTPAFAANQYTLFPDSPYRFSRFRKTRGYANHPLDGIWLRAPYLHNGSVPTLRALLDEPSRRPTSFYRGYDVFDQQGVGFVSTVGAGRRPQLLPLRHDDPGQRQRRPRVRHHAARRRQDRHRRVHEDLLTCEDPLMAIVTTSAGRWFRRVVWLGIVANLALALPTIAAPDQVVAFSGLPTVTPHLWARFAGLLLILLSAFYAPAAMDPDRYRANAWLAVVSRLAGVVFFMGEPRPTACWDSSTWCSWCRRRLLLFIATRTGTETPSPSAAAAEAMKGATAS